MKRVPARPPLVSNDWMGADVAPLSYWPTARMAPVLSTRKKCCAEL